MAFFESQVREINRKWNLPFDSRECAGTIRVKSRVGLTSFANSGALGLSTEQPPKN